MTYQPIFIIGAPRSGTNMLRDVITRLPGCATWPCDEINYIWRYGNKSCPHDEFTPEMARADVKLFIKKKFQQLARKTSCTFVIEKTCANSLRIPFIHAIFPESKFLFITRNGIDVIFSAMKRWKASMELSYLMKKARFVPFSDIPYYAFKFFLTRINRSLSSREHVSSWGPRFIGIDAAVSTKSLAQVCALQWKHCIEKAGEDLKKYAGNSFLIIQYESFVKNPTTQMEQIMDFINCNAISKEISIAVKPITEKNIGKGLSGLNSMVLEEVYPIISDTMHVYGYELSSPV